jgi:hypothetical protein
MKRLNDAPDWLIEIEVPTMTLSRVFRINGRTYMVCLGCGRQFEYAWETMSMLPPPPRQWHVGPNIIHHAAN